MPDPTCRVAIVGAGYTAREHARAFADVPGVVLAGIASRTHARAEALAAEMGVPLACGSVAELWERTQADLVVVTVNELSTNAVCKACFEHPWTVLVEKPPGYTLDDALDIESAANAQNRRVLVALNRRSMGTTVEVSAALASATGPRFVKVQDQEDTVAALANGHPKAVVDHWMYANAIHMIDYLRIFARGAVTAVERITPWNPERPGVVLAHVRFDSGDSGLYEGIWHAPGPWAVSVTVPERRWELRPLEVAHEQRRGEKACKLSKHPRDDAFKPGFRLQAERARDAAMLGSTDTGLATIGSAMETMRLISEIFRT